MIKTPEQILDDVSSIATGDFLGDYQTLKKGMLKKLDEYYAEVFMGLVGEDEIPPVGEQGKFDPQTRTYELLTDTDAVKYHIQRVSNQNNLRAELRKAIKTWREK